jgi:hypothetical protein
MAILGYTVDSAKKKELINIFLLMPETRVDDAMKKAKFTEEDIANLLLRCLLQRALPGGSIKGLKAYIAGLLLPLPNSIKTQEHEAIMEEAERRNRLDFSEDEDSDDEEEDDLGSEVESDGDALLE